MEQSNRFFATARPWRLFWRVAIPGLISMLAMSLYQTFEGAFVGNLIGEAAFAAVNIGMPVVMINFSLADLVGVGSSAPISVALGRQDEARASNIFTCSIILIVALGALMGLIVFFTAPFFVSLMGAEGELAVLSVKYVRVFAIMSPVTTVVFAMDNYLRISGFVKGSMFLNIFMSALTVGFLALFLGGAKMNVEGSALASCLAMLVCAIIAFIPFIMKRSVLRFVRPKFDLGMIKSIVACGTPTFLSNIAGRVTAILMNSALLSIGESVLGLGGGQTAVAAYSVLMYVSGVVEPMLYGMSDSVQPAIGYNWGAGSLSRVAGITKVSFIVCGIVSVLCAGVMFAFPEALAGIFVDEVKEPALMALSVHAIPYFGLAFLFGWFCFAVQGFFAAIEKPFYATVVSIAFAVIFPVILIYALMPMGLDGLWLNYFGRSVLTGILAVALILLAQKKMKKEIEMQKKLLCTVAAEDFDRVYDIMELSFPEDEVRSREGQRALMMRNDYRIYAALSEGTIIGFITEYDFPKFSFVEHFAVAPAHRGGGLGSSVLREFCTGREKPVCLEVELPDTETARRRIGFYERNGFSLNDCDYIQPPIEAGKAPVPLLIMSYGRRLTADEFREFTATVHREVYGVGVK